MATCFTLSTNLTPPMLLAKRHRVLPREGHIHCDKFATSWKKVRYLTDTNSETTAVPDKKKLHARTHTYKQKNFIKFNF